MKIKSVVPAIALLLMLTSCQADIVSRFFERDEKVEMADPMKQEGSVTNTINIGMYDIDTFNPLITQSQTVREAMEFVYEPLFTLNELVQPEPILAKDYGMNADGKTIIINLREDVQWHDGEGFDAYDVAYTIRQIREGKTTYTGLLSDVTDCTVTGDYQLAVSFNHSIPNAAALFIFPIVKYNSIDNQIPIGTGPFAYSGKISTDRYMLNAFDYYYGGKSSINGIYIDEAPDLEHYIYMCSSGAFDVSTSDTIDLRAYTPKGSVSLNEYVSNNLILLGINHDKPELQGVNTRLALSQLIDKEHIGAAVLYSRAVAVDTPINPSFWLYDGRKSEDDGFSAEIHIKIDAWTNTDNGGYARTINGSKQVLNMELIVNSESSEEVQIAEYIAGSFNRYGIKTTVVDLPYEQYAVRLKNKQYDLFIGKYETSAAQDMMTFFGSGNVFNYNNEEINSLISQIGMTSDTALLKELYGQFAEKFTADVPFIPIAYEKKCMMSSKKMVDIKCPGDAGFYRMPSTWKINKH